MNTKMASKSNNEKLYCTIKHSRHFISSVYLISILNGVFKCLIKKKCQAKPYSGTHWEVSTDCFVETLIAIFLNAKSLPIFMF